MHAYMHRGAYPSPHARIRSSTPTRGHMHPCVRTHMHTPSVKSSLASSALQHTITCRLVPCCFIWCDAVQYGTVRCGAAVRCSTVRCSAMLRRGAARCGTRSAVCAMQQRVYMRVYEWDCVLLFVCLSVVRRHQRLSKECKCRAPTREACKQAHTPRLLPSWQLVPPNLPPQLPPLLVQRADMCARACVRACVRVRARACACIRQRCQLSLPRLQLQRRPLPWLLQPCNMCSMPWVWVWVWA